MTVRRRRPGPPPLLVAVPAVAVLLSGLGIAGLHLADGATVLDEDAAVAAFRAGPTPSPTPSGAVLPTSSPAAVAGAGPAGPVAATAGPPAPGAGPAGAAPAAAVGGGGVRPSPTATPSPLPARTRDVPPGVYRYATSGSEQVDVLGGARHDYPASTTITYRRSGCGTLERWQPLQERVGESLTCDGAAGSELRASFQQRSFFGRSQSVSFTCSPGAPLLPRDPQPGATTRGSCRSDDSTLALTTTVVGVETLDVGGTAVPVVHLSVTGALAGATRGRSDREVWLARSDGLLVRVDAHTDTDADTDGGTVRYQEDYRLELSSLTPRT